MSLKKEKGKQVQNDERVSIYSLPSEVMELIGFYCSLSTPGRERDRIMKDEDDDDRKSTTSSSSKTRLNALQEEYETENPPAFATPPVNLRNFLVTCRTMYTMLNSKTNSRLYARIFRTKFDSEAISRRFGSDAVSSINLANELRRRCICLKRIRKSVSLGRLRASGCIGSEEGDQEILENFWLAFMMLSENDEKNMAQLKWAKIDEYLRIFRKEELLEDAMRSGYPSNSPMRSLALHVDYMLSDPKKIATESRSESEERLFILRPFVFAAHRYDAFFAPWTVRHLPIESSLAHPTISSSRSTAEYNPFIADLKPKDACTKLTYCGQEINIRPPNINHAACSSFFMKVEQDPAVSTINTAGVAGEPEQVEVADDSSVSSESGSSTSSAHDDQISRHHSHTLNPLSLNSFDYDKDLDRLMACASPHHSRGLCASSHIGDFEGSWEGRFSFFDFDSYRDMLGGKVRSLYEGPFGEQAQVWKLREHVVRVESPDHLGGKGSLLNGGYYDDDIEPSQRKAISEDELEFLRSYNVNKSAFLRKKRSRHNDAQNTRVVKALKKGDWIPSEIVEDWPNYPSFEDEESASGSKHQTDEGEGKPKGYGKERYEILISGTGHSAWGKFILRGRVRSWDGLVSITKEYRPDGRGRWLYRGYLTAGNKIVGRWRDTFTPEDMSGYEGCFIMHRRGGGA